MLQTPELVKNSHAMRKQLADMEAAASAQGFAVTADTQGKVLTPLGFSLSNSTSSRCNCAGVLYARGDLSQLCMMLL